MSLMILISIGFSPLSYSGSDSEKVKRLEQIIKKQKNEIKRLKLAKGVTQRSECYSGDEQYNSVGRTGHMEISYP